MGTWLQNIKTFVSRSLENPANSLTSGHYAELFAPNSGGVYVTHDTALTLTAFRCGVDVISGQIARYRFSLYRENEDGSTEIQRKNPIHRLVNYRPNPTTSRNKFWRAFAYHLLIAGNAYALIVRNKAGFPLDIHLLNPFKTQFVLKDDGKGGKTGFYQIEGGEKYPAADVIHVCGISFDGVTGDNPINQARQALALALNAEAFGVSFFENGCSPSSFYTVANMPKNEAQEAELRKTIEDIHRGSKNANKVAVVPNGVSWNQTGVDPEKAQAIQTRQHQILEVCRLLNCPPHKLMDFSRATHSNIEETNRDFVGATIAPWLEAICDELTLKLIPDKDQDSLYVDVKYSDALFGNLTAQTLYYKGMVDSGLMTRNEVRAEKGLNPVAGGDKITVQLNLTTLDQLGQPQTTKTQLTTLDHLTTEDTPKPKPVEVKPVPTTGATEAVRSVLLDSLSRMIRRETAQVRKAYTKRDPLTALEGVYRSHGAILSDSLTPAVSAWNAVTGSTLDARELASRMMEQSRSDLAIGADVEAVLSDWEENRAKQIVEGL